MLNTHWHRIKHKNQSSFGLSLQNPEINPQVTMKDVKNIPALRVPRLQGYLSYQLMVAIHYSKENNEQQ